MEEEKKSVPDEGGAAKEKETQSAPVKQEKKEGNNKKGGKKQLVIICIGIVIIAMLGVIIYLLLRKDNGTEEQPKRNVVTSQKDVKEAVEGLDYKVDDASYNAIMNTTWKFEDGWSPSYNAYVENSTANNYDVYFDIVEKVSGDTIYESPIIPVGSHIEDIVLSEVFSKGTYDCILTYTLVDKDQSPVSEVSVGLTIVIEN